MKVSPIARLFSLTVVLINLFTRSVSHPILQSAKLDSAHSPCLSDVLVPWKPETIQGVWFDLARTNLVYKANTWTNGKTSITFQADSMLIDYQGFDKANQCQSSSLQLNGSQIEQGFLYIDKMELNGNAVSVVAVCLDFADVKKCKEDGHLDLFLWSRHHLATNESSDELRSELTTILEKYCIKKENMIFADDSIDVCQEPNSDSSSSTTTFIVADLSMLVATESAGEQVEDNLVKGTTPTMPSSSNSTSTYPNQTVSLTTGSVLVNQTGSINFTTFAELNKTQSNSTQVAHVDEINVNVLIEPIAKENSIEKDLLSQLNRSQANTTSSKKFNANAVDTHSISTTANHTYDEGADFEDSLDSSNGTLPISSLKKQMVEGQTVNSTEQENLISSNWTQNETLPDESSPLSRTETTEASVVSEEARHESTSTTSGTQEASTTAATSTTSTEPPTTSQSIELESTTALNEEETAKTSENPTTTEGLESASSTGVSSTTETSSSTLALAESTSIGTTTQATIETTSHDVQVVEAITPISINVTETLLSEPTVRLDDRNESAALNLSKKADLDEEPTEALATTTQTPTENSSQSTQDETTTVSVRPTIDAMTNETQSFLIDSAPLDAENATESELTTNETITTTAATTSPSSNVTFSGLEEEEENNATSLTTTEEASTVLNVEDVIILTTFETHVITSDEKDDEHEEDNQEENRITSTRQPKEQEDREEEREEEREDEDEEERETTTHQREDHDDDDDDDEDEEEEDKSRKPTSTTMETSTTTTFMCVKSECQVRHCNFGRRRDELGCETCDCMRDPTNSTQCTETVCHPCFYGAYTDENGCESCACKPRPKPKNIYECPQLECASCNYGSIKDEYGCETCICIRPNSLERSYPCPPEPTCPFGACKHGSVLNDYGCATCECLKSNEPEHDLECTRQRCEPCPHGYFTDADGCETCLCKPDWMAPCALVELSCDVTRECPFGTYLDRNGCPSCECLPDPSLKSDCYHMKEIDEHIECNPDGSFKPTQCNDEECRCVTKYGTPISEFRVNVSDSDRMNCECALALYEISVYKAIGFKLYCLPNGNYETIQCVGGSCACVNEHGDPLGPSVPIYQKHLLRCEGVFQNVYEDQFVTTMAPITLTKPLCIYHQERAIEMSNIDAHLSIPNCDDRGLYAPLQCDRHNKYCWCVNVHNGVELYGSRRTADQKPECSDDEDD